MVKEARFYELLEVSVDCTDAQLKSAYKKGALRHHPDKNRDNPSAAEKFKDISKAYEVLSDPQKRSLYDQYGEAGLSEQGGGGGMNAEDLFSQFFGGGGGLGSMFGGGMRDTGPKRARTIHHVHKVSLEDIYNGKTSKLALQKSIMCPDCDGRGGKPGAVRTCTGCNGAGMKTMLRQMGPMIQRFQTVCPDCQGEGEIIREKDKCRRCKGKKTDVERKVLHVNVPKGAPNGHKIEFRGEGDQLPGVQAGDVLFEIEQKPHPRFRRQGNDLIHTAKIHLYTALTGGDVHIQHLDTITSDDGLEKAKLKPHWLVISIVPGEVITPGQVKQIQGQGMPSMRHHEMGKLFIQFEIEFPKYTQPSLAPEARKLIRDFLGVPEVPREVKITRLRQALEEATAYGQQEEMASLHAEIMQLTGTHRANGTQMEIDQEPVSRFQEIDILTPPLPSWKDIIKDDVVLDDVDPAGARSGNGATMEDEEEEGAHAGGERMQCASQ